MRLAGLAVWGAMALLWIFRADIPLGSLTIPGWSRLFGQPAYLSDATVAMATALVLALTPARAKGFTVHFQAVYLSQTARPFPVSNIGSTTDRK